MSVSEVTIVRLAVPIGAAPLLPGRIIEVRGAPQAARSDASTVPHRYFHVEPCETKVSANPRGQPASHASASHPRTRPGAAGRAPPGTPSSSFSEFMQTPVFASIQTHRHTMLQSDIMTSGFAGRSFQTVSPRLRRPPPSRDALICSKNRSKSSPPHPQPQYIQYVVFTTHAPGLFAHSRFSMWKMGPFSQYCFSAVRIGTRSMTGGARRWGRWRNHHRFRTTREREGCAVAVMRSYCPLQNGIDFPTHHR